MRPVMRDPAHLLLIDFITPHHTAASPVLYSRNDNIRYDRTMVACEHSIVRKSRLNKHAPCLPPSVTAPKHKINALLFALAMMESGKRRPLSTDKGPRRDDPQIAHDEFWFVLWERGTRRRVGAGRERETPSKRVRDRGRWRGACKHGIGAAVGSAGRAVKVSCDEDGYIRP